MVESECEKNNYSLSNVQDIVIGGNGIMSLTLVFNSPNQAEKIPPTIMNLRVLL